MKIIDLNNENMDLYLNCLSGDCKNLEYGMGIKKKWYNKMKEKGLKVKIAVDDNGNTGGMIQYLPVEYSWVTGNDLYFINCIWVYYHKKGRGNFRKKGMGVSLLKTAEDDVKKMGKKGLVVWGLSIPVFMRANWFKKHGYIAVDKDGISVLLWKSFCSDAVPPKWIKRKKLPGSSPGKLTVTLFINGWCSYYNQLLDKVKKAIISHEDKIIFDLIDTSDNNVLHEWGISDGLFINGKEVKFGPPPSYEKIKKIINKNIKKLK